MPRKPRVEIAGYYHVINRGVEQRVVFEEKEDYEKFEELLVLKYNDVVWKAKFSKDENKILSWSDDGVVKTYKLYRDRKLKKEYYPLEAEVESGCTLTKSGEVRVLSTEEWEEKKRRL